MQRAFEHVARHRLGFAAVEVHAAIEDLGRWNAWSPFYAMDPEAQTTVSIPSSGEGARYGWQGKRSGRGTLTVAQSVAPSTVVMRVDFDAPIASTSVARFDVVADEAGGCEVTWTMTGTRPWWLALLSWATGMDAQMVGHFRDGLRALEALLQGAADGRGSAG